MNLKEYQENAINKLTTTAMNLLKESGDKKKMVFKSPTGSGKTLMIAEFLRRLTEQSSVSPFSCIWIAPRKLHFQSKKKLEQHYKHDSALSCAEFNDLYDREIRLRQILFLNWESVHQKDNLIILPNEHDIYLDKVLENTKGKGRKVILIIDESHFHMTKGADELIDAIDPKLIINVSATPKFKQHDELVRVKLEDVKAEGMIKKSVIINDGVGNVLHKNVITIDERTDVVLLQEALQKRNDIASEFQKVGSSVNPLLCIQLPDQRTEQDAITRSVVMQTLKKSGITASNGKLAIKLNNEEENMENIFLNDNIAEVILFKHALALGWDCPRAHILVLFRDWKKIDFSIQTLGRIMRMPEPIIGHYQNDLLDNGYVYTNRSEATILEDVAGGYVCLYTARRIGTYSPLKLPSVHRLRQREKTRLSPRFIAIFLEEAKKYNLKDKININAQIVEDTFIDGYKAESVEKLSEDKTIQGDFKINISNETDLQKIFDYFVRDNLSPYYPDNRSIIRVRTSIYEFFGGPLSMGVQDYFSKIILITLSKENREHFIRVLEITKEKYKADTEQRSEPLQDTKQWEIPKEIIYGDAYEKHNVSKSAFTPFFMLKKTSDPEKKFISLLEKSPKVVWWYKNGESESKYFAVPYKKEGKLAPFYVDFIVLFTDGTIGLYDPKSGFTIDEAKAGKNDGLLDYIQHQKRAKKKIKGGIVALADPGGWKIYQGRGKDLTKDLTKWDTLEI